MLSDLFDFYNLTSLMFKKISVKKSSAKYFCGYLHTQSCVVQKQTPVRQTQSRSGPYTIIQLNLDIFSHTPGVQPV